MRVVYFIYVIMEFKKKKLKQENKRSTFAKLQANLHFVHSVPSLSLYEPSLQLQIPETQDDPVIAFWQSESTVQLSPIFPTNNTTGKLGCIDERSKEKIVRRALGVFLWSIKHIIIK